MDKKKKIIISSIGAVVILILVSLINVVAVKSTTLGSVNQSPLFWFRTQIAINKNLRKTLSTDYLNKDENTLVIPQSNRDKILFQKLIDRISSMNDEIFNHLIIVVLHQIRQKNLFKDINPEETVIVLNQIKNNLNLIRNNINQKMDDIKFVAPTCIRYGTLCNWIPGCFLFGFLSNVFQMILDLLAIIGITTALENCFTSSCTIDCTNDHGCSHP